MTLTSGGRYCASTRRTSARSASEMCIVRFKPLEEITRTPDDLRDDSDNLCCLRLVIGVRGDIALFPVAHPGNRIVDQACFGRRPDERAEFHLVDFEGRSCHTLQSAPQQPDADLVDILEGFDGSCAEGRQKLGARLGKIRSQQIEIALQFSKGLGQSRGDNHP